MVKLIGPGLSAKASGTLAGELIFTNWKGRAYLKKHRAPKQPQTNPQISMRAAMTFLSQSWAPMAGYAKRTWDALAAETKVSAFNAYQAYNLNRWRSDSAPTCQYPAAETGSGGTCHNYGATVAGRGLLIEWDPLLLGENWGYLLFAQLASAPPRTWSYLKLMQRGASMDHVSWHWSPLPPGLYYFKLDSFTFTGKHTPNSYSWTKTMP